jgi:hypothetical protein
VAGLDLLLTRAGGVAAIASDPRWAQLAMARARHGAQAPAADRADQCTGTSAVAEVVDVMLVRSPTRCCSWTARWSWDPAGRTTWTRTRRMNGPRPPSRKCSWPASTGHAGRAQLAGASTRAGLGRPAGFATVWPVRIVLNAQSAAGQQRPDGKPGPEADRAGANQTLRSIQRPAAGEPLVPVRAALSRCRRLWPQAYLDQGRPYVTVVDQMDCS